MKQKAAMILVAVVVIGLLGLLSALNYSHKEKTPDRESDANRSTYNAGATGSQAFFSLLNEIGRRAIRWQQSPAGLVTAKPKDKPAVFVVVGYVRRAFTRDEVDPLLQWVSEGGRLILIDRQPDEELVRTTAMWMLTARAPITYDIFDVDPSDQRVMTERTDALKPVQPSIFTEGVNAVQPSKFAGTVGFTRRDDPSAAGEGTPEAPRRDSRYVTAATVASPSDHSPTVHLASPDKNILVDAPFGEGRIVILSDPYIISNGGISLADNARLAVNLVSTDGIVAFDEYHHGYGGDNNRLLQFFSGTPVVAIFLQALVLLAAVFFSQGRRFARAIPEQEPDRLTKLEYVAAMAELQQRTRAYDLAMENIYTDFRRRAARSLGLDAVRASSHDIAAALEVSGTEQSRIEGILFKCEEIMRGESTNKSEVVELVKELRAIEAKYNLRRRGPA